MALCHRGPGRAVAGPDALRPISGALCREVRESRASRCWEVCHGSLDEFDLWLFLDGKTIGRVGSSVLVFFFGRVWFFGLVLNGSQVRVDTNDFLCLSSALQDYQGRDERPDEPGYFGSRRACWQRVWFLSDMGVASLFMDHERMLFGLSCLGHCVGSTVQ